VWCAFFKPCTKLKLHCDHRSGHLKTEHTESLLLLRRHLGNWYRGPAVSMRSELLVVHEELGQRPLLTVYVVPVLRVKNTFFINFGKRAILLCTPCISRMIKSKWIRWAWCVARVERSRMHSKFWWENQKNRDQ
jgi:hypothetical protein